MERKDMVKRLGEHFGVKPKYMGMPSCAYRIETENEVFTVGKDSRITKADGTEVEFEIMVDKKSEVEAELDKDEPATEENKFEVSVPMEGHNGASLRNIVNMISSKQPLIKKSLGLQLDIVSKKFVAGINEVKEIEIEQFKYLVAEIGQEGCPGIEFNADDSTITFQFYEGELEPDKIKAYTEFVALLNKSAKEQKHASAKVSVTDNEKFTFRVFLMKLGMIGDEYKLARKVLLERLDGNSAFRNVKGVQTDGK